MAERARPSSRSQDPPKRATTGRAGRREEKANDAERPPARADLKILESRVFRGQTLWSYDPCIRLLVYLGSLELWPSNMLEGFNQALLEMLPGLKDHSCSLGRAGGFVERLREGTWLGHVSEHAALELQRESGAQIFRGKTRSASKPGQYNVIFGYQEESVGLAAGQLAVRVVNHLVEPEEGFDFLAQLEGLIRLAEQRAFGR